MKAKYTLYFWRSGDVEIPEFVLADHTPYEAPQMSIEEQMAEIIAELEDLYGGDIAGLLADTNNKDSIILAARELGLHELAHYLHTPIGWAYWIHTVAHEVGVAQEPRDAGNPVMWFTEELLATNE